VRVALLPASTRPRPRSSRRRSRCLALVRLWCLSEEHAMRDELLDDVVIALLSALVVVSLLWWVL
jgi:hypothetical protein